MKKLMLLIILAAVVVLVSGCESTPGTREYVPGKGWVPVYPPE